MNKIAKADVLKNEGEKRVWNQGIVTAYSYVLSFLDTLKEKSEKPINLPVKAEGPITERCREILENEAKETLSTLSTLQEQPVCEELDDDSLRVEFKKIDHQCFEEGVVGWQKEKLIARHFYELGRQSKPKVSEELEKYASQEGFNYVSLVVQDAEPNHRWNDHDVENAHRDGIIKGASWQKEQDTRDMCMSDNRLFQKVYELGKKDMKKQMMKEAVETWMLEGSMYEPEFIKKKVIVIKEDNQ